mgnify:CR=1 FL=1
MKIEIKKAGIFALILILIVIAAQVIIFITPEADIYTKIAAALGTIALIAAFVYAITGFKKGGAGFYSTYMLLYALAEIGTIINLIMNLIGKGGAFSLPLVFTAATVIALFILAYMKDVGRKASKIIVTVILIGNIIMAFASIISVATSGAIVGLPVAIIRSGQSIMLATVAFLLVEQKYEDKAERGTT